jgi:hypothetical protein
VLKWRERKEPSTYRSRVRMRKKSSFKHTNHPKKDKKDLDIMKVVKVSSGYHFKLVRAVSRTSNFPLHSVKHVEESASPKFSELKNFIEENYRI